MRSSTKWAVVRVCITTCYLFAGWLLFTGSLDRESLVLGGLCSFLVALLTFDSFIAETEVAWRSLVPRMHWGICYLLLLLWKIYQSSFVMAWIMLSGSFRPRVVHFRTRLRSDIARAMLATSITLTPGTVALEMDEDHLVVHWMSASTSHSRHAGVLIMGGFEKLLRRLWG
ncbi:multicomponent Na+:H+ antiporter subunit E [Alkalispirochaeta americana]|uniref:Multicomponent Na+:H+ antiporter subunit E n=1 Tax=Alkalispirochaeta americana TaxID=159291 RepID=A0A1N6T6A4_9SPIO|nr:Na+/H+ antiporter subunit E [Alkalispirochaeta americana]SIQ48908.1 multicomponent Na+:H+ antiporter subunit E [Alkalispirochaeta americana]